MSKGRKNVSKTFTAKGIKKTDILSNLTLSEGGRKNLVNENFSFKDNLGLQGGKGLFGDVGTNMRGGFGKPSFQKGRAKKNEFLATVTQLDDTQIDNLNTNFSKRSSEVLSRRSFQGRDQLLLTDRSDI